jgi:8-oxo-dGTP pyrophosphatase MutT (NUDIX family)
VIDTLEGLRARFRTHEPVLSTADSSVEASVALILSEREYRGDRGLNLLFIRRAENEADRWSGQIAFPGGRIDAMDAGPDRTAERETFEEVGISISASDRVGRLDDLEGSSESIVVSGFVYALDRPADLELNHEIAEAFWLPLRELANPDRHVERTFPYLDQELHLPALKVLDDERHAVLWGLSYRFLQLLMEKTDHYLPPMPWRKDI